uniref:Uncharacterized protein n=1 Tax=Anopheles atroparvus TaxID=41427 RepID=A0AAG5DRI8_ANOAO
MDKGRHITRICFCLVAMVIITVPHGVISLPCTTGTNGQMVNTIGMRAPEGARSSPALVAPVVVPPTPSAIKKDLFMSRGWGASGMPFSMFYLNHYTKAQKAYAQNQLQQQQQQQKQQLQLQLQAQQQQELQPIQQEQLQKQEVPLLDSSQNESTDPIPDQPQQPNPISYAPRYDSHVVAVAQQLRTDTDYVDSSPSVRTTSKVNTARRQYTVPQLFVSYGWGPMG